jgi:hypothetical protein
MKRSWLRNQLLACHFLEHFLWTSFQWVHLLLCTKQLNFRLDCVCVLALSVKYSNAGYALTRWVFMQCIFCSFFQILYSSDLCGVYLVSIHAEGWICEGLNPEMFDAMHWPHLFSVHLLLKILTKNIWIIKPHCGGVLCCWYDLWSHFLNLWYCV